MILESEFNYPMVTARTTTKVSLTAMAAAAASSAATGAEYGEEEIKPHSYATYEDYLDSQVSELDMYYLEVGLLLTWLFSKRCYMSSHSSLSLDAG